MLVIEHGRHCPDRLLSCFFLFFSLLKESEGKGHRLTLEIDRICKLMWAKPLQCCYIDNQSHDTSTKIIRRL